jgi:hypothetical protein
VNQEGIGQAGEGQNPQYLLLGRRQHQISSGLPGLPASARQRGHAAGVHEFQGLQVHDDCRPAGRDVRESSRDARGVCHVKFPAQRDDNVIAAFVGTQIRAEHRGVFLLGQQGGVWTRRLVRRSSLLTVRCSARVPGGTVWRCGWPRPMERNLTLLVIPAQASADSAAEALRLAAASSRSQRPREILATAGITSDVAVGFRPASLTG